MTMEELFGEVIYSYSRAQAIEDGVLVNLIDPSFTFRPGLNICAEAGIKYPVAMTIAATARRYRSRERLCRRARTSPAGLWDVLTMFKAAAKQGGEEIHFPVSVVNWVSADGERINRTKRETVILKAICGPGDSAEPVITVLLSDED